MIGDLGCYVDSSWGIYAIGRAIIIAEEFGYVPTEEYVDARVSMEERDVDFDELEIYELDKAEEFLNRIHGTKDTAWYWNDGDFGYWKIEKETVNAG